MRNVLRPVRFMTIFAMVVFYLTHLSLVFLFVRERWARVRISNRILTRYSRFALWVLAVKVRPEGLEHRTQVASGLYVGNHLSYLDVLVISSQMPTGFVTSTEIRETPGLGLICEMSGCLFVERRSRANLRGEVAELSEGLRHGLNVAIFPEATSTNGEQILRFKRPLYMAAVEAKAAVVPFCLNYRTVGGEPINRSTRDCVFWYGDMDFAPHLWALAGSGGVDVELHFLAPIDVDGAKDPSELAILSQTAVEKVFRPVE